MPPPLAARDGGSGLTVGWLLAIALAGGSLLFVSIAFILVTLADRRKDKAARLRAELEITEPYQDLDSTSANETSSERPGRQHRRRLTKSPSVSPSKRRSAMYILPQITRSGSLSNLFSTPRKKSSHERRQTSWIDEDAIHGPKITKTPEKAKRSSFRDSLIKGTPTLPALLGYRAEPDSDSFYRHDNHALMTVAGPRPVALPQESQQMHNESGKSKARGPLVRTPSYELAQKRAAAARGVMEERQQQQRQQLEREQEQQKQTTGPLGPRPPPAAKLRPLNPENNLHEILKLTEQRLREGSPAPDPPGPAKRTMNTTGHVNRPTWHRRTPASQGSPIGSLRQPGMTPTTPRGKQYTGLVSTPSPQKTPGPVSTPQTAPAVVVQRPDHEQQPLSRKQQAGGLLAALWVNPHARNPSQTSAVSEADSLFGESTTDADQDMTVPAGLSSPSRRVSDGNTIVFDGEAKQEQHQPRNRSTSVPSMTSSVSSALSTVYSEEEAEETYKPASMEQRLHDVARQNGNPPRSRFRQPQHGYKLSDPFVMSALPEGTPYEPPRSQGPSHQPKQASKSSIDNRPLNNISGNAQSVGSSPIMASTVTAQNSEQAEQEAMRMSIMMSSPELSNEDDMRPKSVASMKPTYFATSASLMSMKASPSTPEDDRKSHRPKTSHGSRSSIVPPLNLPPTVQERSGGNRHQTAGNPTIVLRGSENEKISLAASPPPNRALPDTPKPSMGTATAQLGRRRSQTLRADIPTRGNSTASNSSSIYSDASKIIHGGSPNPGMNSTFATPPSAVHFSGGGSSPTRSSAAGTNVSPLQASIIQLRRMNSQMSARSVASSAPSERPASPTLTDMRGGGFSPDRSNSRMGKAGRQNYLNLGTPSPTSTRGSGGSPTKGPKRNSVRSAMRNSGVMGSTIEEKENGNLVNDMVIVDGEEIDTKPLGPRRGSLKGSRPYHATESPRHRHRMSVRFGDVEEHLFEDDASTGTSIPPATPKHDSLTLGNAMTNSPGLYDKDGFLMSSPERLASSAAEGGRGHGSGGLRI